MEDSDANCNKPVDEIYESSSDSHNTVNQSIAFISNFSAVPANDSLDDEEAARNN